MTFLQLRAAMVTAAALAALCSCSSNRAEGKMKPLPPCFDSGIPDMVPIILLGDVVAQSHAAGPPERSEWTDRWTQLWTVRVRIEQILKGDVPEGSSIDISYFPDMDAGSFADSRVLHLHAGQSYLFFLQRDFSRLRTICDGWGRCVLRVRTGRHSSSQIVPALTLPQRIVNMFLSRGDHTTDAQMLDAIYHPEWRWGKWPVYHALERLAKTDKSPQVQAIAEQQARKLFPLLPSEQEEQSAHQ